MLLTFLFFAISNSAQSDLLRTVYCRNQCNDYLNISETNIPLCGEDNLKMNKCGTVISCSWSDVEIEKHRRVANSTETIVCCYNVDFKEKGDCDSEVSGEASEKCDEAEKTILLLVIVTLISVILLQAICIGWTCFFKQRIYLQKISNHEERRRTSQPILPIFTARPNYSIQLLSNTECGIT